MKKLKSVLCAVALIVSLASLPVVALAGEIPGGGYVERQGEAPDGFVWSLIDGLWFLMSI
jgi:hypothetical protein